MITYVNFLIVLRYEHKADSTKLKTSTDFIVVVMVILLQKHEQVAMEAAAWLLISSLPVEVQALAAGLGSAYTQL